MLVQESRRLQSIARFEGFQAIGDDIYVLFRGLNLLGTFYPGLSEHSDHRHVDCCAAMLTSLAVDVYSECVQELLV